MIFSEFNSRCPDDLIDFQSQPDEKFKYKYKWAKIVAHHLLDIFTLLGVPSIL